MLEKLFGFDPSTMTLRKEVIGGITTFLTMALGCSGHSGNGDLC